MKVKNIEQESTNINSTISSPNSENCSETETGERMTTEELLDKLEAINSAVSYSSTLPLTFQQQQLRVNPNINFLFQESNDNNIMSTPATMGVATASSHNMSTPATMGVAPPKPNLDPNPMQKGYPAANDSHVVKKRIPAFLMKLIHMLEAKENKNIISWSKDGRRILVKDPEKLAKNVLHKYFKHSQFASFARQLNMYGFRKVQSTSTLQTHTLSFENENFIREIPELILGMYRHKGNTNTPTTTVLKSPESTTTTSLPLNSDPSSPALASLLADLHSIKTHQQQLTTDLAFLQHQHQQLYIHQQALENTWRTQSGTVEKIVGFLASVFGGKKGSGGIVNGGIGRITDSNETNSKSLHDVGVQDQIRELLSGGNSASSNNSNGSVGKIEGLGFPDTNMANIQDNANYNNPKAYEAEQQRVRDEMEVLDDRIWDLGNRVGNDEFLGFMAGLEGEGANLGVQEGERGELDFDEFLRNDPNL